MKGRFRSALFCVWLVIASAVGAQAQVLMDGHVGYRILGSGVTIYVEDIENLGNTTTDRLRLRLWVSDHHWSGPEAAQPIAVASLPRLRPQRDLDDVHRTVNLHRPSTDWYYVTLTLEERVVEPDGSKHWEIRDAVEFDGQRYFVRHTFNPFWPFD